MNNLGLIIKREFMERVSKKSFIVTTLLMPVFMLLMMALPAILMEYSQSSRKTIAIVDKSGIVFPALAKVENENLKFFVAVNTPVDSLLDNKDYYGVLSVPANIAENPSGAVLYTHDAGSMETEAILKNSIQDAVRDKRMHSYNIPDLQKIIDETNVEVELQTLRINDKGEEESTSSALSFGIGMFMTFLLYMCILMYGQLVMTSIIEEKNNRVLELVVSSVKPVHLMLGKILGVCCVAVLQIVIWGVLMCTMSAFLMPLLIPADIAGEVAMMNAGTLAPGTETIDSDLLSAISLFSSVKYIALLFLYLIIFLVGGFLFYASIFAAIGSAVDNIQDASQLTSFATIPIIIAAVIGFSAGGDPNSALSFWGSIIPFTSPMVMMMRIPFGIPAWQIWLSIGLLYASFLFMLWLSAKIYRIGIFMYGKKPTLKDLARWATYK